MAKKKANATSTGAASIESTTQATTRAPALQFTVLTSTEPERLAKVLSLDRDGTLNKQAAAPMMAGTVQRLRVSGLQALAQTLDQLNPAQAVGWGICSQDQATIVAECDAQANDGAHGAISRTRQHFAFPRGPGADARPRWMPPRQDQRGRAAAKAH